MHPLDVHLPLAAAESPADGGDWRLLAPLPDRVGYAGMFAGVLDGRLVAGGGSQFPDKPLWLGGNKAFSDRIFTLPGLREDWTEAGVRLPRPMAHFAFGQAADSIVLAGGCDAGGVLRDAWVLRTQDGTWAMEQLPDLPEARAYAAGIVASGRFYVAGGQPEIGPKVASAAVWSLDLAAPENGWRREPDLPDAIFVGAMAEANGRVYFIGGVSFDQEGRSMQSRRMFRLDRSAKHWETLPNLPEPRVGPVAPVAVHNGRMLVVGGYSVPFKGAPREHPGFARSTFIYDLATGQWDAGSVLPHRPPVDRDSTGDAGPAPMVAAAGALWQGCYIVVGGEVRASVRTPAVLALPCASWSDICR